jgi:hypothetical protein
MLPTIATGNVGSALAGEYEVANSLRFNDDSSDYLNRTPSSAGSTRLATFSLWLKRANLSVTQYLYMVNDGTNQFGILFGSDNKLKCFHWNGSSYDFDLETSALFRDVSAWYHIVIKIDTANATAIERLKLFVNNEYVAWNSTPSQNFDGVWLKNSTTHIGATTTPSNYLDGYIAEFVAIDGTALDPTSFGEFDSDTNIWKPIDVSGLTFGTNGFYLDFENSGSLGADVSGNGNNFTVNNLTSIDQTTDTCTNNFCTWNPLVFHNSKITFSEGNLVGHEGTNDLYYGITPTIFPTAGKWYAEAKFTTLGISQIGLITAGSFIDANRNLYSSSSNIYMQTGQTSIEGFLDGTGFTVTVSGGSNSSLTAPVVNDIIMFAWDLDNGRAWYGLNGTWQNSGNPETPTNWFNLQTDYADGVNLYAGLCGCGTGDTTATVQVNWGNPPYTISSGNSDGNGYGNFEYSVPSGYYALNTKNLAEYG